MNKWSENEIFLLSNNINKPYVELMKFLPDRTIDSIISKKDRLNLSRKSSFYWSTEQDRYLIKNYHKTPISELEKSLDKKRRAIHSRINRLRKQKIYFGDKKKFLSKYWKRRYKTDKELISNHKKAIVHLWTNLNFKERHKKAIKDLFKNPAFYKKHRALFIKRRNSKEFKLK